ncbi:MAG TPA: 2-amino-4-hydroxy-6-hydroxymethyldihydropteridine diphosphokinase [Steroidobacteraceae bacterium]|nr:2-amino-4-hydroxy-6-hydroxymethyldihydropteridine diphosphokinase [Steroidobacteraceae bacterium]
MPQVYVAAGSNVEPERHLALASAELERRFGDVQFSRWYRNRAVGFDGDDFINFVFGFHTALPVEQVIGQLREVEALCGRPPGAPKWAPRTMDLDILLYGDLRRNEPGLKLPRPDLLKRPYMLGPLADIAASVRHPTAGVTIGELWRNFDQGSHRLEAVTAAFTSQRSGRHPPREPGR